MRVRAKVWVWVRARVRARGEGYLIVDRGGGVEGVDEGEGVGEGA